MNFGVLEKQVSHFCLFKTLVIFVIYIDRSKMEEVEKLTKCVVL